jgi:hypothetical protein
MRVIDVSETPVSGTVGSRYVERVIGVSDVD